MNNSTKVWLFILSTCLFILIFGYQLGGRLGLLIGFLFAIGFNVLIFFYGENQLLHKMNCRKIMGQDAWGLIETTKQMSNLLGIDSPRIYIFPSNSVTSFCTSRKLNQGSIAVSEALLQRLTKDEITAVLAHQVCQISHMDSFAFSASSTIANALVGFGEMLDKYLPLSIFETLFSPIGWLIIKPISTPISFFETDAAAAEILDSRFNLGKILWKLNGYAQAEPLKIPPCTSHLFITNPEPLIMKNAFLKIHPSIESRLQRLLGYFPP